MEHSRGSCLESFECLQEFLEGSWVERSGKQRFSSEEERGAEKEEGVEDGVERLGYLVRQVK